MRVFMTGGTGVLGRAVAPLIVLRGHELSRPGSSELDLFDADAVAAAVTGHDAVLHLATRIPSDVGDADGWAQNDRLRIHAARILVDACLALGVQTYVQASIALFYPPGPADEDTPLGEVPAAMRSALVAEAEAARFAAAGRRGVALRFGLLDGPHTGNDEPVPAFGATLNVRDAGTALTEALSIPSGVYNVVRDGERVSNARFKQAAVWSPIF